MHEASLVEHTTARLSQREIFLRTTITDRNLSSATQAGLVNNLNDGLAWGLFPLIFAATGLDFAKIGILARLYPGVWGVSQLGTGGLSDRIGRKWLIAGGTWLQAAGIIVIALWGTYSSFAMGTACLGLGTAMVYPTLLASIGDVAHPAWRASAVGVYRLWRDLGYALGALMAGVVADLFGLSQAALVVAGVTFYSGWIVAFRMEETRKL